MRMEDWFYQRLNGIVRVIVVGMLGYAGLVFFVRWSGKRSLAKMNSYDLVVTVAMGSMLGNVVLNRGIPLIEGLTGFAILIGLQFLGTWLSTRSATVRNALTAEPTIVFLHGNWVEHAMKRERLTKDQVTSAMRARGAGYLREVDAVVLEANGDLSCLLRKDLQRDDAPSLGPSTLPS